MGDATPPLAGEGGDGEIRSVVAKNDTEDDLLNQIGDTLNRRINADNDGSGNNTPELTSASPSIVSDTENAALPEPRLASPALLSGAEIDVISERNDADSGGVDLQIETVPDSSSNRETLLLRIAALTEFLTTEKSHRATLEANLTVVQTKLSDSVSERDACVATIRQLKEDHALFAANGKAHYEKRLQDMSAQMNQVAKQAKDRDQMARNAIEKLKQETGQKLGEMQKQLEAAVREKDLMGVRYAEGETKVIKAENDKEKLQKSLADVTKDKDVLLGKVKTMRDEKVKMQQQVDAKQTELTNLQKEVDRVVENFRQSEQKARWLQGKMASESEGMGELKQKVERLTNALKDAKEEADKSKKHYEGVIREYQRKEEEQETDTTVRAQEKEVKRIIDEQLIQEKEKAELGFKSELEASVKKSADLTSENHSLKTRLKRIEEEKLELVSQLNDLHHELVGKNGTIGQLAEELKGVKTQLSDSERMVKAKEEESVESRRRVDELQGTIDSMKEAYEESHVEVDNYSARNAELLSFTEKVSSKNTQLLSETANLKSQLDAAMREKEQLSKLKMESDVQAAELRTKFDALQTQFDATKTAMKADIATKAEAVTQLQQQLEDEKNEIKVMKKKHAMAIKELSREIQGAAAKKFFEGGHGSGASSDTAATLNSGSRTGSMTSLDNIPGKMREGFLVVKRFFRR